MTSVAIHGAPVIHCQATAYVRPFPVDQVEVLQIAFAAPRLPITPMCNH
jgi:hypothetical protein